MTSRENSKAYVVYVDYGDRYISCIRNLFVTSDFQIAKNFIDNVDQERKSYNDTIRELRSKLPKITEDNTIKEKNEREKKFFEIEHQSREAFKEKMQKLKTEFNLEFVISHEYLLIDYEELPIYI